MIIFGKEKMMDFLIRSIPSIPGGKISVTQFIWCLPIYEVDVKKLEIYNR